MIGPAYWAIGITIQEDDGEFGVYLDFFDDGWIPERQSTEGRLRCRYKNSDLGAAIDTLKADAERLGIRWGGGTVTPTIYVHGDEDKASNEYKQLANEHAERLGWRPAYNIKETNSMNTIWKYELKITDRQTVEMPAGAKILTVQIQEHNPTVPQLWAEVNPANLLGERHILMFGTGAPAPAWGKVYIGTVQIFGGSLVWHVFEDATS